MVASAKGQPAAAPGAPTDRPPATAARQAPGWLGRAWGAPLAVHALVLLLIMAGVAALIGTGASFTDDEGAGILQARAIEAGHWTMADPLPKADPTGAAYPVNLPSRGTKGTAPLAKHLLYFVLLAALDRLFGPPGMVGLSIAGTVAAALLAARLAREFGSGLERPAFWVVGLASPLFFDGFLVVAHTAAAALVAASVLLGLSYLRTGGLLALAGTGLAATSAALLRTEGLLWCAGLAAGAAVVGLSDRRLRSMLRPGMLLVASLGAGFVAHEVDVRLSDYAIGAAGSATSVSNLPSGIASSGVSHQIQALWQSWFQVDGNRPVAVSVAALLVLLAVVAWAELARRGRAGSRACVAVAGAVAALSVFLVAERPSQYVSGIAVVFPLLWAGLWLLGHQALGSTAGRLVAASAAVYGVLVALTQYSDEGSWQNGRYFFLAIPAVVPLVMGGLVGQLKRLSGPSGRIVLALVVVSVAALTSSAVSALNTTHRLSSAMTAAVRRLGPAVPAGDGGRPVFITTAAFLPREQWPTFESTRWLLIPGGQLRSYGPSLRAAGIHQLVLVTDRGDQEIGQLADIFAPLNSRPLAAQPAWHLVVLRSR
ncbi:MAG TPA: hypothetical protein VE990_11335 [Acidimicrobiales bacterium]|nr:hypothetical protein [Acidimicrobiales bacterium]